MAEEVTVCREWMFRREMQGGLELTAVRWFSRSSFQHGKKYNRFFTVLSANSRISLKEVANRGTIRVIIDPTCIFPGKMNTPDTRWFSIGHSRYGGTD